MNAIRAFVAVPALIGCDDGVKMVDRPDAVDVNTSPTAIVLETTPRLNPVSAVRIDGMQHDLVPIQDVVVAPDGRIAIGQMLDHGVRFFTRAGEDAGRFGGKGAGPGEFTRVVELGWLADTLWVSDPMLQRVTLISPTRELLRTVPVPSVVRIGRRRTIKHVFAAGLLRDGSMLVTGQDSAYVLLRVPEPASSDRGHLITTLKSAQDSRSIRLDDGSVVGGDPFQTGPFRDMAPDGSFTAIVRNTVDGPHAGSFRVIVVAATGDTMWQKHLSLPAQKISAHARDSVVAAFAERISFPALREAFLKNAYVPEFYPIAEEVWAGTDTTVLIQVRHSEGTREYLLLNGSSVLGMFQLPERSTPAAIERNAVWSLERNVYDVQSIVRYDLRME